MWVPTTGGGRPSTKREGLAMLGGLCLLCVVFAVMKLTGHFPDSWICVFAPLWGAAALIVFVLVAAAPGLRELWRIEDKNRKGRRK